MLISSPTEVKSANLTQNGNVLEVILDDSSDDIHYLNLHMCLFHHAVVERIARTFTIKEIKDTVEVFSVDRE